MNSSKDTCENQHTPQRGLSNGISPTFSQLSNQNVGSPCEKLLCGFSVHNDSRSKATVPDRENRKLMPRPAGKGGFYELYKQAL